MKVVIACGGTGGHVFPGLAVANALKRAHHDVCVWYSGRSIESSTKHGWDGSTFETSAPRLTKQGLLKLPKVILRCRKELQTNRPDVLLAMGSYTSLPPVLAAWSLRIPICLHEANAVPGKAIKFLSRFATHIAVSFPETMGLFPKRKVTCTGLPVREAILNCPPLDGFARDTQHLVVLVTGGSQGAHAVNELVVEASKKLPSDKIRIIHQCGVADEKRLSEAYQSLGVQHHVAPFIPDMGRAYASADLVIARAGASTCFELCAVGKPAILIPLPSAANDHQTLNAMAMDRCGGAILRQQKSLTPDTLAQLILELANDRLRLEQMGRALKSIAICDATEAICQQLSSCK